MIGMMYLVLTAMLALNVSADILNGFTKLRHSMEETMKATDLRTAEFMDTFKAAYEESPGKYEDWWIIAQAVRSKSNEFYNYVEGFKLDIINMIDGTNYASTEECEAAGGVKNNSDTNKPQEYSERIGEGGKKNEDIFKEKMDEYRTYLTVVDSKCLVEKIELDHTFAHEWELKRDMMKALFSTDDVLDSEGEMISFQRSTFHEMPAGATLALLTKYQNDIRVAENDLVNFMMAAAGKSKVTVNYVEAIVRPEYGEYIMQGQHYRARIVSAMLDTTDVPKVFINGQEITNGVYDVACGTPGQYKYSGYMMVTGDTTRHSFTGQYTVGAPSATISNTDLNIMYRDYNNPFSISVPGTPDDKVKVSCSGASVSKSGKLWIIVPKGAAERLNIEVAAEVDGKIMPMGKQEYRVKDLPTPNAYFAKGNNYYPDDKGCVPRKDLLDASAKVVADYGPDGLVQAKFTISSFSVKLPSGKVLPCTGDKIDKKVLGELNKLKAGSQVTIVSIKAKNPGGKEVAMRPLPLQMN